MNAEPSIHPTAAKVQDRLRERGLEVVVQVLPDSTRTAPEAAAAIGCEVGQIVKSLVFVEGDQPVMVLCAGDRRVPARELGLRAATADEARAATGFAIGGIPPLAHDRELRTLVDSSLRRFDQLWCAAGTPHAVFGVECSALLDAVPAALEFGPDGVTVHGDDDS